MLTIGHSTGRWPSSSSCSARRAWSAWSTCAPCRARATTRSTTATTLRDVAGGGRHRLRAHRRPGRPPARARRLTNAGWRNLSFRGYADYMQTPDSPTARRPAGAAQQTRRADVRRGRAWRCHRSLIADALLVLRRAGRGDRQRDARQPHMPTPLAPSISNDHLSAAARQRQAGPPAPSNHPGDHFAQLSFSAVMRLNTGCAGAVIDAIRHEVAVPLELEPLVGVRRAPVTAPRTPSRPSASPGSAPPGSPSSPRAGLRHREQPVVQPHFGLHAVVPRRPR